MLKNLLKSYNFLQSTINLNGIYLLEISNSTKIDGTRSFISMANITNKRKEYRRRELVGYSMQQMYDVVAGVDKYVTFIPYCKESTVFDRVGNTKAKAKVIVGFPPLHEGYTSNLTFEEPHCVKSECFDGRLFNYLLNLWYFTPGVKDVRNSCVVDFSVTFEFKSLIYSRLSHMFFELIIQQMETAFQKEAERRYGQPEIQSHLLSMHKS